MHDLLTLWTNPWFLLRMFLTQAVGFTLAALIMHPSFRSLGAVVLAMVAHALDWTRLYYYVRGDLSGFWVQYWRGISYAQAREIYRQRQQMLLPRASNKKGPPTHQELPERSPPTGTLEEQLVARADLVRQAQSYGLVYAEFAALLQQEGEKGLSRIFVQAQEDEERMRRAYSLGIGQRTKKLVQADQRDQADELLRRAELIVKDAERLGVADTVRSFLATGHDDTANRVIADAEDKRKRAEQTERLGERIRALTLTDRNALLKRLEVVAAIERKRDFTRAFYALEKEVRALDQH